ncbi:hypothetical protein HID58_056853 [Brassica napus]|uniref:Glutaminyl-tRNA synthetase class Ib non-specific RNA-binding domain-containing protein n=1 Tax=Brassica napus TaxID=3708 RepID=A0ABQ8APE4_BRANA|nr:hypothetical protein HID58_056853 [Brassica napus]
MAPNDDESVKLFLSIGLDEKTATTTINNPKVTANLTAIIHEVSFLISPPPSPVSSLSSSFFSPPLLTESKFYELNSKFLTGVTDGCDRTTGNLLYTVRFVLISVLISFFDNHAPENFKLNEFEEACSVGVEVSAEDIEKAADEVFEKNKKTIVEQRYRTNVGQLLGHVRKSLPWADPKIVKVS